MASFAALFSKVKLENAALAFVLAVGAWFAWHNHFMQDDAYISFRYAKHFAEGHGLVWYPGSTEYGYTNFLFTLLVGLLMAAGLGPETAAAMISVPAYFGALTLTFLIGRRIAATPWVPFLAALALATHLTFSAYATGGLETSLQTFLVLGACHAFLCWRQEGQTGRRLVHLALFSAAALLTRLDSCLLLFPAYAFLLLDLWRGWKTGALTASAAWREWLRATAIPVAAVASLLAFAYLSYGYALPNTFYAKVDDTWYFNNGLEYLALYLKSQAYAPVLLIGAWLLATPFSRLDWPRAGLMAAPLLLWLLYLLRIGGDFMEYRLLVPVLPFFFLTIIPGLCAARWRARLPFLLALLVLSSVVHHRGFYHTPDEKEKFNVVSLKILNDSVNGKPNNWKTVGQALHKLFYTGSANDVKIAVTAGGAIPYFSGLPTIDLLGLNTREALKHGRPYADRPGHRIKATTKFLRQSRVNLVIDHPVYPNFILPCFVRPDIPFHDPVPGTKMLFIPLNEGAFLLTYYLTPHPRVEELIALRRIIPCRRR